MTESPDALAREYGAARERAALHEPPPRSLLVTTGPLRQKFLHGILSNDVQPLKPGEGRLAALMDVKGRLLAFVRALVAEGEVLLETPSDRLDLLERQLVHYKVAAPVKFERRGVRALAVVGPGAEEVLARAGAELPPPGGQAHRASTIAGHAVRLVRATDLPSRTVLVHAAPGVAEDVAAALVFAGAEPISGATFDALRVEDGRPQYGRDVLEENLLHETGLVREYHSPSKGCYVGQEVVARLEGRGANVSRLLRGLRLEAPVADGAPLTADGRDAGRVTTAAVSPRLGPIALAWVHRSRYEPGSTVDSGATRGTVVSLPFPAA